MASSPSFINVSGKQNICFLIPIFLPTVEPLFLLKILFADTVRLRKMIEIELFCQIMTNDRYVGCLYSYGKVLHTGYADNGAISLWCYCLGRKGVLPNKGRKET